jgi:hypothetical protein
MLKKSVIVGFLVGIFLTVAGVFANAQTLPTVTFSKAKVPNIAAHIAKAQAAGKPSTLTYLGPNSPQKNKNRAAACGSFKASAAEIAAGNTSCDEYPFATTSEGGAGASVAAVPTLEQSSQGGTLSGFYSSLKAGDKFKVAVGP